jgi:hypothetical protein
MAGSPTYASAVNGVGKRPSPWVVAFRLSQVTNRLLFADRGAAICQRRNVQPPRKRAYWLSTTTLYGPTPTLPL